jgi:NTP pyrophosphatase (non-canonical NTP hydrolase)
MEKFELENRKKYGAKNADEIAKSFEISESNGAGGCFLAIRKYLKRFISESEKAGNIIDLQKVKDYANRLNEHGIIPQNSYLEKTVYKDVEAAYNYFEFLERAFFKEYENRVFETKFKELLAQNYNSIVKRGLINSETNKRDFIEKLHEEVAEFEYEFNISPNKVHTPAKEELTDIILVCLNIASHYEIDILKELENKIKINEKRKPQ